MEMHDVKTVYEAFLKARETKQETEIPTEAVLPEKDDERPNVKKE